MAFRGELEKSPQEHSTSSMRTYGDRAEVVGEVTAVAMRIVDSSDSHLIRFHNCQSDLDAHGSIGLYCNPGSKRDKPNPQNGYPT